MTIRRVMLFYYWHIYTYIRTYIFYGKKHIALLLKNMQIVYILNILYKKVSFLCILKNTAKLKRLKIAPKTSKGVIMKTTMLSTK